MNFTVEWEPEAKLEWARIWAGASDSEAVRAAGETAELVLGNDPLGAGHHVAEGLWRVHVLPLLLHYTIDQDRQWVEITDVRFTG